MIELAEGIWIDPFSVTMVKRISDKKCALWTTGQPGSDGHVLDYAAEDVVEVIDEACSDTVEEEDDEDES